MRPLPPSTLAVFCLALAISPAHAEAQNGGAAVAIDAQGIRVPACVVVQPDSGALVLLEDTRNANIDVYVQRVDRRGRPTLGKGGTLVWSSPIGASLSAFSPDGAGGILFAWTVNGGASGQDVMVERVLANGTLAYALPGIVACNAPGDQTSPSITPGAAGSYWLSWLDGRAGVVGQADVYVQRFDLAGVAQLAAGGIPVNSVAFRSTPYGYPSTAPGTAGALLLSWSVNSPGGIRAQRVSPTGVLMYGATGAALADPSDYAATITSDGSGGIWATTSRWSGSAYTPYAHHLLSTGISSFVPAGIAIHSANAQGFDIHPVRDATNGCFFYGISWLASSTTGSPMWRQQVSSGGVLLRGPNGDSFGYSSSSMSLFDTGSEVVTVVKEYPGSLGWQNRVQRWAYDGTGQYTGTGVVVGRTAPNYGETAVTAAAAANHVVVEVQADPRYNTPGMTYNYQAFGQAFSANGTALWDDAENPSIVSAKDAPGDQGGFVRVTWDPSAADHPAAKRVKGYRGWRSLELAAASQLAARHAGASGAFMDGGKRYVAEAGQYWEQVAETPATQLAGYALSLPTGQDSTAVGVANQAFMIEAFDDSLHHWYSNAMTAHSVDNVAPAVPAPFTGQYVAGTTFMLWHANTEPDLAGYRLYRGSSAGFVPGLSTRVASPTSPGFDDHAGFTAFYKLSSVDVHGNESGYALLLPSGALDVDGGVPHALAFTLASRNPARGGATLRLALPAAGRIRVAIFDAGGREVRSLADGEHAAGELALAWDGADATGRAAPSGLYFARLTAAGQARTVRFALTR